MSQMNTCLSQVLKDKKIIASSPGRVDLGGGIDHRIISLICHTEKLKTFNIAIKLYTTVTLAAYRPGYILIDSDKIGSKEYRSSQPQFNDKYALVSAITNFFNVDGVKISIKTEFPPMSGLGGSGSLSVSLITAFIKALNLEKKYHQKDIVWLAHSIEDSLFKNTGLQDQAAACFGGINLFKWQYSDYSKIFFQKEIKNSKINFENTSLVVYSGCPHYLTQRGSRIIHSFFNQPECLNFVNQVNQNTNKFTKMLKQGNLEGLKQCLNREEQLRHQFLKYRIPAASSRIISIARKNNCGVKFVGGGGGGCLWILGEPNEILKVKNKISQLESAKILKFSIDYSGVQSQTITV